MQSGCVICYDSFESSSNTNSQQNGNDDGIVATLCGHVFHRSCLQEWLRRSHTCPECRSYVSRQYLTKLFINFCVENQSDNNTLDELEEKLCGKDLECIEKERKITGLEFDIALSERKSEDQVKKIEELQACFAHSELQILEKDRKIEELQNCFAYSELQILEKDRKIEELQTSFARSIRKGLAKDEKNKELESKCASLKQEISEKNKKIEELQTCFTLSELGSTEKEEKIDELKNYNALSKLEISEKDKKIEELQTCVIRLEQESLKKDEKINELKVLLSEDQLLQKQIKFDNKIYNLKWKVSKLSCAEAKNQLLQDKSTSKSEKNILVGEVEHPNTSQTIMEESSIDVKKILVDAVGHALSEEEETAIRSLATYCSVLKQKLTILQKDKTQLQNELIQVKQELASSKEKNTRLENAVDEVEPELTHSKEQRSEIQTVLKMMKRRMKRPHSNLTDKLALLAANLNDFNSIRKKAFCDPNSVPRDVQSNLLPRSNLSKCNLTANTCCDSCSKCKNQASSSVEDVRKAKRQKIDIIVLD